MPFNKVFLTSFGHLLAARVCFSSCHALLLIGLPLVLAGRNVEVSRIGFVMGSYAAGVLVGRPVATWLLGSRSRKWVATLGALLIFGSVLFYWGVPHVSWYLVIRVLQGVGSSLMITATTTMAIDQAPKRRRGRSLSYLGMSHTSTLAAGPVLAVILLEQTGSDVLFATVAGVTLIGLALLSQVVEEVHPESLHPPAGRRKVHGAGRPILVATILLFLNALVHGGAFYFLPLHVSRTLGGNSGLFFTCFALAALSGRFVSGQVSDRWGRLPAGFMAQILLIAGVFLVGGVESMVGLAAAGLVYGAGFGAYMTAMSTFVSDHTSHENRPRIIAVYFSALDLGNSVAGWTLGPVAESVGVPAMLHACLGISLLAGLLFLLGLGRNLAGSFQRAEFKDARRPSTSNPTPDQDGGRGP